MKNLFIISLAAIFIQGCSTPYKHSGFRGGYSEIQLDENVFKVSFRGNGYTGRERASDFTLLRCAELALENGYKYFVIINANSYTSKSIYTTPTTFNTTGNGQCSSTTTTTGGQTYIISKPSSSNIIVCFKEKPDSGFSYNVDIIYKNISLKYNIK